MIVMLHFCVRFSKLFYLWLKSPLRCNAVSSHFLRLVKSSELISLPSLPSLLSPGQHNEYSSQDCKPVSQGLVDSLNNSLLGPEKSVLVHIVLLSTSCN